MDQLINLPPTPYPVQEVAPKGHIFIKVLVTVLVLGLLGGGSAWAYFQYFAVNPEMQIYKAFMNGENIKTNSFTFDVSAKGKIPSKKSISGLTGLGSFGFEEESKMEEFIDVEVKINVKGIIDETDKKNAKQQFSVSISGKEGETELEKPFLFEFLNDSKVVALRIPKIPSVMGVDFSDLNNQWVAYDYSKFREKIDEFREQKNVGSVKKLSDEDEKRLIETAKRVVLEKPPLTVTKKFKKENVSGVETQPYAFSVSKENFLYLMQELAKDEKFGIKEGEMKEVEKFLDQVTKLDGTIWVSTGKESLPYKISLAGDFQDEKFKDQGVVHVVITMAFADFNKPVTIEAPKDAITFEEAFKKIMAKADPFNADQNLGDAPPYSPGDPYAETDVFGLPQQGASGEIPVDPYAGLEGHAYVLEDNGESITIKFLDEKGMRQTQSIGRPAGYFGGTLDNDSDGLEEIIEKLFKTDLSKGDTDGDGLSDGWEVNVYKTHPLYKDTDGDGYDDGMEVKTKHDPLKK